MPKHKSLSYDEIITRAIESGHSHWLHKARVAQESRKAKQETKDDFEVYLRESLDAARLFQTRV